VVSGQWLALRALLTTDNCPLTTVLKMLLLKYHRRIAEVAQRWKDRLLDCNDGECNRSRRAWRRLSNGAASIHLDGLRYCFPECFERRLHRRFLEMQASEIPKPRPPHRVPLGLLMLSRGHVTNAQLRRALETQQQNGSGKIGEWIQKLGYAPELQVTGALAVQWSCPVIKSLPRVCDDYVLPLHFLRRFRMVPVKFVPTTRVFHIAFAGDIEYAVLLAVESMLTCKTEACLTTSAVFESRLNTFEQLPRHDDKMIEGVRTPQDMTRIVLSYATKLKAVESRMAAFGEHVWIRMKDDDQFTNLLFERHKQPFSSQAITSARDAGH